MSTTVQPTSPPSSAVANSLRQNSLSAPQVSYFMFSAIASLLVVAGVIPTFFAVTGLTGAPVFFLAVALVLALFAVGYVAMARHIRNAGAFNAFIRWGLGRTLGVPAGLMALLAYNALQVSIYGLFGPQMSAWALSNLRVDWPWWFWSLIAWGAVTILGLREVGLSKRVLAALSIVEIGVIVLIDSTGLAHPGPDGLNLSGLSATNLFATGAAGAGAVMGILGFIGFEMAPVFGEEARNHRRTIAFATYFTLALVTVVYVVSCVAMLTHYGVDQVATVAGQQGPDMMFGLAGAGTIASIGRVFFLTSMFAALLAFHNAVGRYAYSLGREGTLPKVFGRTGRRSGAPWTASLAQSILALAVICVVTYEHWDPVVHLFFWTSTTGGFGVLVLLAVTSVAVVGYFARRRLTAFESLWRGVVAPALAALLLAGMVVLAVQNFPTLIGVPVGSWAARLLPASYLVPLVVGLIWAAYLRVRRPAVYAAIGLGPDAILSPAGGQR